MSEEDLRYCAMCGQPLEKNQKKFCSRACSGLFQAKQHGKKKKSEEEKMQNEVVGLDNILDPNYTNKDFLEVPAEEEYNREILFSFTPNYSADIPVGTATVYGTPKALADYQFEYFHQKNEILPKTNEQISLRVYMLTGDVLGEAKDIAAFQLAYEKLLEKSTTNEDAEKNEVATENVESKNVIDDNDIINTPPEEIFEEPKITHPKSKEALQVVAEKLNLPKDSTLAEVRKALEINKNNFPVVWIDYFEEVLDKVERGEIE